MVCLGAQRAGCCSGQEWMEEEMVEPSGVKLQRREDCCRGLRKAAVRRVKWDGGLLRGGALSVRHTLPVAEGRPGGSTAADWTGWTDVLAAPHSHPRKVKQGHCSDAAAAAPRSFPPIQQGASISDRGRIPGRHRRTPLYFAAGLFPTCIDFHLSLRGC